MKKITFILFIFYFIQTSGQNINVITQKRDGQVLFKVVPKNYNTWQLIKKNGLVFQYSEDISDINKANFLNFSKPIVKTGSKSDFETQGEAGKAALELLNKKYTYSNSDPIQQLKTADDQELNLLLYLFLTSRTPKLSEISGLQNNQVLKANTYFIRIFIKNYENDTNYSVKGKIVVNNEDDLYELPELKTTSLDKSIGLQWNHAEFNKIFATYNLLRSERPKDGQKVNSSPIFYNKYNSPNATDNGIISYTDSVEKNDKSYFYQLVAQDYFGYEHPSGQWIEAKAKDLTPPNRPYQLKGDWNGAAYNLEWQTEPSEDLEGFRVLKADNISGPFDYIGELLSAKTRSFEDQEFDPEEGAFYMVVAQDKNENMAPSEIFMALGVDSFPPPVPENLIGEADTTGKILIAWDAVNDKAKDLEGYRVFKSLNPNFEFISITPEINPYNYIIDSFNKKSLDEYVYYKIESVDKSKNHSAPSEIYKLKLPDLVAPSPPVLDNLSKEKDSIKISWTPSYSKDVVMHILQIKKDNKWVNLKTIFGNQVKSLRVPIEYNQSYYRLVALDDDGLFSEPSNMLQSSFIQSTKTKIKLSGKLAEKNNETQLQWVFNSNDKVEFIYIYRAYLDYYTIIHKMTENTNLYKDKSLEKNKNYQYKIAVKYKENKQMVYSNEISINQIPNKK